MEYKYNNYVYNSETGIISCGRSCGHVRKQDGYVSLRFNGKKVLAHRLIWFIVYGYWPKEVDHINRIRSDNRLINLREVSSRENSVNQETNTEYPGTRKFGKKFQARIKINRKEVHLGMYNTQEEAYEVYLKKFKEVEYGQLG